MVNTNVQSAVPLLGRGLISRSNDIYDTGEYPVLSNVFIKQGKLQSRHGIKFVSNNMYAAGGGQLLNDVNYYQNMTGFIGTTDYYEGIFVPTVVGKAGMFHLDSDPSGAYRGNKRYSPEVLLAGQTNINFHYPVKHLAQPNPGGGVTISVKTTHAGGIITHVSYYYGTSGSGTGAPPAPILLFTVPYYNAPSVFVDAFFFKERLWIVTNDTVYFSGVGSANYLNFTPPVGGFFKYSGITSVVALKDTVYVLTRSSLYALTYSDDPNLDAVNINISNSVGGVSCTIHSGSVYFTDAISLYSVNNNSVSKILDLDLFPKPLLKGASNETTTYIEGPRCKILSYKNYIVFLFHGASRFGTGSDLTPYVNRGIKVATSPYTDNTAYEIGSAYASTFYESFHNMFMLNMDEGTMNRIVFRDNRDNIGVSGKLNGFIVDAVSGKDYNGKDRMFLMTSAHRNPLGASVPANQNTTNNFVYEFTDESQNYYSGETNANKSHDDYYYISGGTVVQYNRASIPFHIVIKEFCPDGNEYLMKKFRALNIMGSLPNGTFISFEYNKGSSRIQSIGNLLDNFSTGYIRPNPYRIGINQRARSISIILFYSDDLPVTTNSNTNEDILTIEDMRTYWTYTGKPQKYMGAGALSGEPL